MAAAAAAIVTSDTSPQRQAFGEAAAYVPPGDAAALADELRKLADQRPRLWELQIAAHRHANDRFRPAAVIDALDERLAELAPAAAAQLAA